MKTLVTGGAGFIGSHLVERLLERGHEVVSLDSFDRFYDPALKEANLARARASERFQDVRGDIRDADAYLRLPDDIDTVVHLAARAGVRPSIEDPALYMDVNLTGTMALLRFMRERGIRRLLFGSSSSVYGDSAPVPFLEDDAADRPISPYAATKRAGELVVHAQAHLWSLGAICLRFFTVYGPRQRPDLAIRKFATMMSEGREIPMYGDGSSERDYTYIDDIVDGIEGALAYLDRHPEGFQVANLGGAHTVSLRRMIDALSGALGLEAHIRQMPDQPGDVRRTSADVSWAEKHFDYRPSVPFEEGIGRFVAWFVDHHTSTTPGRDGASGAVEPRSTQSRRMSGTSARTRSPIEATS